MDKEQQKKNQFVIKIDYVVLFLSEQMLTHHQSIVFFLLIVG